MEKQKRIVVCKDCGKKLTYFASLDEHVPIRCTDCRLKKKEQLRQVREMCTYIKTVAQVPAEDDPRKKR